MALSYLFGRFFYRIWLFLSDWYIGSFRLIWRKTIDLLESLDRTLAVWITFKNLFQPLYQDRTFTGRILGFLFRSLRVLIALALYAAVLAVGIIIYGIIFVIPIYILYWGFGK